MEIGFNFERLDRKLILPIQFGPNSQGSLSYIFIRLYQLANGAGQEGSRGRRAKGCGPCHSQIISGVARAHKYNARAFSTPNPCSFYSSPSCFEFIMDFPIQNSSLMEPERAAHPFQIKNSFSRAPGQDHYFFFFFL